MHLLFYGCLGLSYAVIFQLHKLDKTASRRKKNIPQIEFLGSSVHQRAHNLDADLTSFFFTSFLTYHYHKLRLACQFSHFAFTHVVSLRRSAVPPL